MKITKLGHCCLIIEEAGVKILTDPGIYSTAQNDVTDIDCIVITHEHGDHLHLDSIKTILSRNNNIKIISNSAVGAILEKEGIVFDLVEHGQEKQIGDMLIEGHGTKHAEIFEEYGQVLNTGYFFNNRLFYPGDALYNPQRPVEILAFPTPGSWSNTKESINYVFDLKPKKCFPVHDGMFKTTSFLYNTFNLLIPKRSIEVILPELGKSFEV